MPWCEPCARYLTPASVSVSGTCPRCGNPVEPAPSPSARVTPANLDLRSLAGKQDERLPWHFVLLVVLLCCYLGWRLVDLFV